MLCLLRGSNVTGEIMRDRTGYCKGYMFILTTRDEAMYKLKLK
jgi:hypothetical protein